MRRLKPTIVILLLCVLPTAPAVADSMELLNRCCRQMSVIHEALLYYMAANDDLPADLGDLVGDYLQPEMLHCPTTGETGQTGVSNAGLRNYSDLDGRVRGYKWELTKHRSNTVPDGRGGQWLWHDFKKRQFESQARDWMPVIRCDKHGDVLASKKHNHLNLTITGRIYSSPVYWESLFPDIIPYSYLSPFLVQFSGEPLHTIMRPRSSVATSDMIDLRLHCNAMLEHPWFTRVWGQEFDEFGKHLSDGLFRYGDIAFDVSGIIQLNGALADNSEHGHTATYWPKEKDDIMIDTKFNRLHVIGGGGYMAPLSEEVAFLDLIGSDGEVLVALPWIFGEDIHSTFSASNGDPLLVRNVKVAWQEEAAVYGITRNVMLFYMSFENPVPDKLVSSLRFRAGDHYFSPFIAGMTISR